MLSNDRKIIKPLFLFTLLEKLPALFCAQKNKLLIEKQTKRQK